MENKNLLKESLSAVVNKKQNQGSFVEDVQNALPACPSTSLSINVQHNFFHNSDIRNLRIGDSTQERERSSSESRQDDEEIFRKIQSLTKIEDIEASKQVSIPFSLNDSSSIPIVHPQMVDVDFYKPDASQMNINQIYKPSSHNSTIDLKVAFRKKIHFSDLTADQQYRSKFIGLIGFPGSGKTVLSKRIANALDLITFYLRFIDISYDSDYKLTLRELLLDNMFPRLCEVECKKAFEWIVNNDQQCAIIIDGYDQAQWTMTKNPPKVSLHTKLHVSDIVANLCTEHFLPGSTLIITSRPHSMITLPKELRPDISIMLEDFSPDTMKKLFFALSGRSAENIWIKLNETAPQLISLGQNPLMLLFVLRLFMNPSDNDEDITTMTGMFTNVLEDFRYSSHSRHNDIRMIVEQLGRIAYDRTQCHSVVISAKNLETENLSVSVVQDLIIAIYGGKREGSKVFDDDTQLFFSHQILQDYFSALHIAKEMPYSKFKEFVYADLFRPHWDVVRRFLCGLLVNNEKKTNQKHRLKYGILKLFRQHVAAGIEEKKKNHLISLIAEKLKIGFEETENLAEVYLNGVYSSAYFIQSIPRIVILYGDIRECKNDKLTSLAAKQIPLKLILKSIPLSSSDCHAIANVLHKVTKRMEMLTLSNCNLDDHSFSYLCTAIKEMPGCIERLKISYNNFSSKIVNVVGEVLSKVDRISMNNCIKVIGKQESRNLNDQERRQLIDHLNKHTGKEVKSVLIDVEKVIILKSASSG